ncbi:surp module domain-containing protein [Toxoplasma gondii ME49]|uniref:Surp module domain-containing protein n=9 Tax=Toxoplasma gondii TaxID=5811 RepID=A0A125YJ12_TOXGV|nr:surp module domain-containing protein [Toxoplasma gondii ME49]EPR63589.1 surp module domain-containing protein [Toxoplasma gondii GT1]ESS34207.1 surp module domain-containing protein [Toxoplasma gondii VEG]KAF4638467.1 surp module domain-containing protein [Toxoplasma gondii]KFG46934.1 surp module domain-containing protein [Toxoplasma gondii GAB2-2007-GAL-DOM2]KYF49278.1 surp module domain-containing protein [Toxoplasma gondii ARI]RQX71952.1 surp module domain-containing protein [Toxoplasm|eukprot:XP_018634922.1 surp module domain-containing protein [Toxoplasma gondii ME49]
MSAAVLPPPVAPGDSNAGVGDPKASGSAVNPSSIVFPPPDLRGIIEKTAQFVAKNGVEFEQRVRREQNNQRFAFLFPNNPYNAYYQLKVREFQTGEEAPRPQVPQAILDMRKKEEEERKKKERVLMLTQYGEEAKKKIEPPAPDVYSVTQPYIALIDVDIIQTTAQFVARNGQRFLSGLAQRERQNPQFEFLKPTHALFQYFTNLVDAYTKCLLPPSEQMEKISDIAGSTQKTLSRCVKRYAWEADQEKKRKEKEAKQAEERVQMQAIDWHDFFIVETIDFTEEDDMLPLAAPMDFSATAKRAPPPAALAALDGEEPKPDTTIAALIREAADAVEGVEEEEMETEDATQAAAPAAPEEESVAPAAAAEQAREETEKERVADEEEREESEEEEELQPQPTGTAVPKKSIRVVKDYIRQPRKRAGAAAAEATQQGLQRCPITGQLVPADQMSNHLRVLLLDPKWKEQKERFLEKAKAESAFAPMEDVEGNLALFVSKRPDLFGSVDEQVVVEDTTVQGSTPGVSVASEAPASVGPAAPPPAGAQAAGGRKAPSPPVAPAPPAKRPRAETPAAGTGVVLLTLVCVGGNGLEDQEIQVEVEEKLSVRGLKESLVEAGIGSDLTVEKLTLKSGATGAVMMDRRTLDAYQLGKPGAKVIVSASP